MPLPCSLRFGSTALFALLVLLPLAVGAQEAGASSFHLDVKTHTAADVENASQWRAMDWAVAARSRSETGKPMDLFGSASFVEIHRYETSRRLIDPGPTTPTAVGSVPASHSMSRFSLASFQYGSPGPQAAAALWAQKVGFETTGGAARIQGVADSPMLVGDRDNYGVRMNPDELGHWELNGTYLTLEHPGMAGNTSGALRFYWISGTLTLTTPEGRTVLESRAWDDEVLSPGGVVRVRHVVWYELAAAKAQARFSVSGPSAELNTVAFAAEASFRDASALTLVSFTRMNGSLPASSHQTGPLLWIGGPLDATLAPQASSGDSYTISISGQPTAYSLGGRPPISLAAATVATAVPTLPLLVLLGFFLRDLVAYGFGRVGLGLYSKLQREKLLDSGTRDVLYRSIQETPGISFLALRGAVATKKGSRLGLGTLTHHLTHLEGFGLVVSRRVGRYRRYFDAKVGSWTRTGDAALLQGGPMREFARAIRDLPGITPTQMQKEFAAPLGLKRAGMQHYVRKLVGQGLAEVRKEGRRRTYWPTQRLLVAWVHAFPKPVPDSPG